MSARCDPEGSRSITWQFVHTRAASSRPRLASAPAGCAKAEVTVNSKQAALAVMNAQALAGMPRLTV
jgi:hypothetical protein